MEANELQVELGLVTATDDDVPGQSSVGSGELTYQLVSNDLQSITISSMVRQAFHHQWASVHHVLFHVLTGCCIW